METGLGAFEVTLPNLNAIQIQALVRDMDTSMRRHKALKRSNPAEFRKKVVEENDKLYTYYVAIFEMHFEGKLDGTFFEMLKMKMKIEKGEITEDEASKIVGQQLFKRYVEPVVKPEEVPAAAPLSYAAYYNELPTSSLLRSEQEGDGSVPDSNK
jgi:hypothetical protein